MALAKDINKLRDDVALSEEKFVKESFLVSSEASKYIGVLPGIKDILGAIDGFIDMFKNIVNAIKSLVEAIMSFIQTVVNVTTGMINNVISGLFNIVFANMSGAGYSLEKRNALFKLFNQACTSSLPNGMNISINSIALVGVIMGISCISQPKAYSTTLTLFKSNPKLTAKRDELNGYIERRDLYNSFTNEILDANGNPTGTFDTHPDLPSITNNIDRLTSEIMADEYVIDELFAMATPDLLSAASNIPAMSVSSVVGLIEDISTTNAGVIAGQRTPNLIEIALDVLDNSSSVSIIKNTKHISEYTLTNDKRIHVSNLGETSLSYIPNASFSKNSNKSILPNNVNDLNVYFIPSTIKKSLYKNELVKEMFTVTATADRVPISINAIPKELDSVAQTKLVKVVKNGTAFDTLNNGVVTANATDVTNAIDVVRTSLGQNTLDISSDITPQVPSDIVNAINIIGKQNAMFATTDNSTKEINVLKVPNISTPISLTDIKDKMFIPQTSNSYIDFSDYLNILRGGVADSGIGISAIYPLLNTLLLNRLVGGVVDKDSFVKISNAEELVYENVVDIPNDTLLGNTDILTNESYVITSSKRFASTVTDSVILKRLYKYRLNNRIEATTYSLQNGMDNKEKIDYSNSNYATPIYDMESLELVAENGKKLYDTLINSFLRFNPTLNLNNLSHFTKHNIVFKLLSKNRLLSEAIADINVIEEVNNLQLLPALVAQV